jgi:16S rRNA (guanine527-N7)-methyltransferase
MLWNQRLHLVAPSTPAEFATRHVLESLLALPHIGPGSLVIDLGSGGGLPIIPCLIARPDIQARLFEASPKKAVFLREALDQTGARQRAVVLDVRFEHRSTPQGNVVTCRAIERFAQMLPTIYDWSPPASRLLFFGSRAVQQWLESTTLEYHTFHIPESTQRYLFVLEKPAPI